MLMHFRCRQQLPSVLRLQPTTTRLLRSLEYTQEIVELLWLWWFLFYLSRRRQRVVYGKVMATPSDKLSAATRERTATAAVSEITSSSLSLARSHLQHRCLLVTSRLAREMGLSALQSIVLVVLIPLVGVPTLILCVRLLNALVRCLFKERGGDRDVPRESLRKRMALVMSSRTGTFWVHTHTEISMRDRSYSLSITL